MVHIRARGGLLGVGEVFVVCLPGDVYGLGAVYQSA